MSDIKDRIDEIMNDMKGRIKNPLITSFILVWCYLHWPLILKAFNDNPRWTIEGEIFDLKSYVVSHGVCGMVWFPLILSFASLATFYLIAGLAKLIKNLLGERFNAWLIVWSDKGRLYQPKEKFDKLKSENTALKLRDEKLTDDLSKMKNISAEAERELAGIKAELESTLKLRDEALINKEKEIGELRAIGKEIHTEKEALVINSQRHEAEANHLHQRVEAYMTRIAEGDKALEEKNERLSELQQKIDNFERSKKLYDELKAVKAESPFNLTTDDLVLLQEIFGNHRWEMHYGARNYSNIMQYEKGVFNFDNGQKSYIQSVSFENGNITFYRTWKNSRIANIFTSLHYSDNGDLVGTDVTFSQFTYGIESSFDISFTMLR